MNILYIFKNCRLIIDIDKLYSEASQYISITRETLASWQRTHLFQKDHMFHPYVQVAQLMTNAALHEEASKYYLKFLSLKKDKLVHSLYLQNLLLSQSATNQTLHDAHVEWASLYGNLNASKVQQSSRKHTSNKIRIGYICHFFDNSISHNVFLPFLKLHDPDKFDVYCYDDGRPPQGYQHYVKKWYDIRRMNDFRLAKLIASDGIDILQEMNGFCFINRFGALAHRPAPIQINWYNHTSTTGLPYIDYVMSDKISIPDEDIPYYIEKAYRCPRFNAAVNFDSEKFGVVSPELPVIKNGHITFGYFGSSHKLTQQGIMAWSEVLKRVPNSRLKLKSGTYSHQFYLDMFKRHFEKYGITSDRLEFEGWTDQVTTLKKYNEIDIMLDNIPVTGGSTLFESLLQGVPAVTLLGSRWAARSGASVLSTLGRPELIATSIEDYIAKAVELASDIQRITMYRSTLRQSMLESSLTNIAAFYQNFEKAYLEMWSSLANEQCA